MLEIHFISLGGSREERNGTYKEFHWRECINVSVYKSSMPQRNKPKMMEDSELAIAESLDCPHAWKAQSKKARVLHPANISEEDHCDFQREKRRDKWGTQAFGGQELFPWVTTVTDG